MLPAHRLARQVLPGYPVEIIDIDVDIIAIMLITVTTMMAIIIMMVVVMVVMIVVIPVYAAEQRIGGGDAQTINPQTFNKTVGETVAPEGAVNTIVGG